MFSRVLKLLTWMGLRSEAKDEIMFIKDNVGRTLDPYTLIRLMEKKTKRCTN